jgi:O-antigen/teichoic acid export membrane protein
LITLREAAGTIGLQAVSPLSQLLLMLVLARAFGPVVQGEYVAWRVMLDLLVAGVGFGLPQSATYVINRSSVSAEHMLALLTLLAIPAVPLAMAAVWVWVSWGGSTLAGWSGSTLLIASVTVALGALVACWRGVLLSYRDGAAFAVSMCLPAVPLLLVFSGATYVGGPLDYDRLFLFAFAISAAIMLLILGSVWRRPSLQDLRSVPFRSLFTQGAHAFVQSLAFAAVPAVSVWLLQRIGVDPAAIGFWGVAALVFQGVASPLVMVAPVLFSRSTRAAPTDARGQARRLALRLGAWSLPAALGLALVVWFGLPAVFGSAYAAAAPASAVMVLLLPALMVSRILAPAVFGSGRAGWLSAIYVLRLGVVVAVGAALLAGVAPTDTASAVARLAIAWLAAEVFTALACLVASRERTPIEPVSS